MSDKPKRQENKINISLDADIAFAQGKISYEEFDKKHDHGKHEKWVEMPFVSTDFLLLQSLLKRLNVANRLRAVKDIHGFSFKDIQKFGGFGGSIHKFFKASSGSYELTTQLARLAITLDIPIEFIIRDDPLTDDLNGFEFLEYLMLDEKVEFKQLKSMISRPNHRIIRGYRFKNSNPDIYRIFKSKSRYINTRIDLRKTFYTVEFYTTTHLFIDFESVDKLVELFSPGIHFIALSKAILRNSNKLVLVGSYNPIQQYGAMEYLDKLKENNQASLLYPYDKRMKNLSQIGDLS